MFCLGWRVHPVDRMDRETKMRKRGIECLSLDSRFFCVYWRDQMLEFAVEYSEKIKKEQPIELQKERACKWKN